MEPQLLSVDSEIQEVLEALRNRNFTAEFLPTPEDVRAAVAARIPKGAEFMTGSSTTLDELDIPGTLTGAGHRHLKDQVKAETDEGRRSRVRKEATLADYFLGSVQAITRDGILVAADASGSRVGAYAFGAAHVILVVSRNKIVPDLEAAMERVRKVALPKESERMRKLGFPGSNIGKWLLIEREMVPGRIHVILTEGPHGF